MKMCSYRSKKSFFYNARKLLPPVICNWGHTHLLLMTKSEQKKNGLIKCFHRSFTECDIK